MEENRKPRRINQPELSGEESFLPLQKKQRQATTSLYILNKEDKFGNASKWKKFTTAKFIYTKFINHTSFQLSIIEKK
jgi:hypothetical protein